MYVFFLVDNKDIWLYLEYIFKYLPKALTYRRAIKDVMDEIATEAENAPIATATRVPPEKFESDDELDDEDESSLTLTATRVS
jgi:hypothetical protein